MDKFKVIGLVVSALGFGLTLVGNWASEKQQEKEMDKMLDDKLEKRFGKVAAE